MSENRASTKENYRGDWGTPDWLFLEIAHAFPFYLDVCATSKNAKCAAYITPDQDALKQPWDVPAGGHWWCNPDFRLSEQFIDKAHEELHRGNPGIMLLPINMETRWFREGITEQGIRILIYPKRINFVPPMGSSGKPNGNNKGSLLAAFTRQDYLPLIADQPWWRIDA